ncbi:amidohydrolase [Streptomyces sp. NPDC047985]|uniref:amidohydrolase n=1 Tax=Streptomyces sp. NPDC047985 TaxID=3155384 RepID=UPI00341C0E6A
MELDLLLTDARVVTMDEGRPFARSVGIWRGRVVGVDEQVEGVRARREVSVGGATVVPGFNDSHNHMAQFGQRLGEIDCSALRSRDELLGLIAARAAEAAPNAWITGSGYDQTVLGGHPLREELDRAGGGRKVLLLHRTSHLLVASTAVFEAVGAMTAAYPDPEGGTVERHADGTPTGLVAERAMAEFRGLRKPFPQRDLIDALRAASRVYLAEGLTSVSEAGIGDSPLVGSSPVEGGVYQRAVEEGAIRQRVQLMVAMENLHTLASADTDPFRRGLDLGLRTGLGDERLRIGPLKMFTDGALMSRTASMTANFCGHDHAGAMQFTAEELTGTAVDAAAAGWQLAVHAIGDHAVDVALDVLGAVARAGGRTDPRHRIEHASVVRPEQLDRFARLGVIASTQGRFVAELGDGVASVLGEDRLPWTYRHASFAERGIVVASGSDRPVVADGGPLPAIQSMVERRTPSGRLFNGHEAVSVLEALRTYTVGSAYAQRTDHELGRLAPGYLADIVVLGRDITACATEEIGGTPVLATVVGGVAEYDPQGIFG